VVAAAADGAAAVFGASDGRLAGPLEAQAGWGAFLGLSRSGDRVFERALAPAEPAWVLERRIGGFPDRVTALDVSPDGRWLAVGSGEPSRNGFVGVWDLGSGQPRWSLPDAHSDSVLAVAVSPDGTRVASGGADRMVKVFSSTDGELLAALEGHAGYATALDWRADGLRLASAGTDNSVRLWDPESAHQVEARDDFRKPVASLAFAGDGSQIVAASGDPALRFEAEPLFTGGDYLHSVAVCALGRTAVAGSQDGTLRVWSLNDKRLLHEFAAGAGGAR
jgi:WD40 repeat protein